MRPKQLSLVLAITLGILSLGGLAIFIIMNQNLRGKISSLRQLQADIIVENERIAQLDQLERQYQEIKPLADKVSSIIPDEKKQDEVIAQISTIVRSVGLKLNSINFVSTQGVPSKTSQTEKSAIQGLLVMPVNFKIEASYAQLQSLLRKFETQERYMQVKNLEISRGEQGLVFNITLEVFVQP